MLPEVIIPIFDRNSYFSQLSQLSPIRSNTIVDKTIPGLGATYSELAADRDSIIILPNVPTIISKVEQHKNSHNAFAMHEGVSQQNLYQYLEAPSAFKKILTTPESFVRKVKPVLGSSMYSSYFLLLDECHKFITDVGYRNDIVLPMEDFFQFENKAMISATPLIPRDNRFSQQGFVKIKVQPEYEYQKLISVIHTNRVVEQVYDYLENNPSDNYCIFFNSIQGIKSLIESLKKRLGNTEVDGKCNIYCSKESATNLKIAGYPYAKHRFDNLCLKFNFFTSSFYNGIDIIPVVKPNVLIITDAEYADYTVINPETDAWQIQGRFRGTEASITHIVNTDKQLHYLTNDQITERVEESKNIYTLLEDYRNVTTSTFSEELYLDLQSRVKPYANLLNADKTLNRYKLDNLYYHEQVKSYYAGFKKLISTYKQAKQFIPNFSETLYRQHGLEKLTYGPGKYSPENYRMVTDLLWELEAPPLDNDYSYQRTAVELRQHFDIIVRAYETLGIEIMLKLCYDHKLIKKALIYADALMDKNKHAIIDAVQAHFDIGRWYPLAEIKQSLSEIYNSYNIEVSHTARDIDWYFKVKFSQRGNVKGCKMLEFNHIGRYDRK